MDENGWKEWKQKVLSDNEETKAEIKKLREELTEFRISVIAELNVIRTQISIRAGLWGAIAGILSAIGIGLIWMISNFQ